MPRGTKHTRRGYCLRMAANSSWKEIKAARGVSMPAGESADWLDVV